MTALGCGGAGIQGRDVEVKPRWGVGWRWLGTNGERLIERVINDGIRIRDVADQFISYV